MDGWAVTVTVWRMRPGRADAKAETADRRRRRGRDEPLAENIVDAGRRGVGLTEEQRRADAFARSARRRW